jgi:hypothetical protein
VRYREALEAFGADQIRLRLEEIATAAGDSRLVLMCYEDLTLGDGKWCHRTMFAEWWQDITGGVVREIAAPAAAGPVQGRLL